MSEKTIQGKVPPQNAEAEQSLLGSILLRGQAIDVVIPIITAEDFYDVRHKKIYSAMFELQTVGGAIDSLTLIDKLNGTGELESVGGATYISDLSNLMPTWMHVEDYAKIIREKADLRKLIGISAEILENSFDEEKPSREIIEAAENQIFSITEKSRGSLREVKDMIHDVYVQMDEMGRMKDELIGLETGYKKIDEATSGLTGGSLVIVAARPSLGKTSLVLNIAHRLATRKQKNILFFSFEMSAEDLIRRMLATGSRVSIQKIRTGKYMTKEEKQKILEAAGVLSETRMFIDTDDNGVFEMRAKVRTIMSQLKRENKSLDLIIIDYMQLVKPDASIKSREQQISTISRAMKAMARETNIPVIALSQLNRESEKRDRTKSGKRIEPKLSDLRESGAIEQDADVVIFIDRDDEKDTEGVEQQGSAERFVKVRRCRLIIAKNRNGPTLTQPVLFLPELTCFEETTELQNDEAFS